MFFFFKQKTAYEMRISDWSSDVCSSDLDFRFGGADANVIGGDRHVAGAEQAETAGHDVTVDARDDRQGAFLQTLEQVDDVVLGPRKVDGQCETLSSLGPYGSSEGHRVGTECCGTCCSRWSPYYYKTMHNTYSYFLPII